MDNVDRLLREIEDTNKDITRKERDLLIVKETLKGLFNSDYGKKVYEHLKQMSGIEETNCTIDANVLFYQRGKIDFFLEINNLIKEDNNDR